MSSTVLTHDEAGGDAVTRSRPGIVASSKWVLIGTVLSKPVQFATSLMLARMLGPAGYGVLGLANATAVTVSGAIGLGLGDAANKFVAENFRRDRTTATAMASLIVWFVVLFGSLCIGVAWMSRRFWAPRLFPGGSPDSVVGLCLLLASGNLLFSLSINLFTGLQQFRQLTVLSLLQAILAGILAAALGWWFGVYGALLAGVLTSLACVVWAARALHRVDADILRWPRLSAVSTLGKLLRFSVPSWLAVFVINPITVFTFSFLAMQPGGGEQLGAFNTANGLKMLVAMLPGLIGSVIGPAIIEEAGPGGTRDAYDRLIDNALAALAFLTIPATILLIFLSHVLFLVYGHAYAGSYALFMPMAAGIAISVLSAPFQFAIVAKNRTWSLLGITGIKSTVLLCLALAWIPDRLAAGLAWASLVADVAFGLLVTEFVVRGCMASRKAATVFYGYAAAVLVVLVGAVQLPINWRWIPALPLAAVATILIIRRHPVSAVWIASAVPRPLRAPTERGLRFLTSL